MAAFDENHLSFTTTAMPRPEILKATYDSFKKNLQGIDFRKYTLYLNVDSYPDKKEDFKRQEVVNIAKEYFGNVVVNLPENPNFASAIKWCFSKIETPYNFHLEDDWELLIPIQVSSLIDFFDQSHIQQVALRAWRRPKSFFWLSPSFLRGSFCREMAEKMNDHDNPEGQIRTLKVKYRKKSFLYFPFDINSVILKDLGRNWIKNQNYIRRVGNFVQWDIKKDGEPAQKIGDQNGQISIDSIHPNITKKTFRNNIKSKHIIRTPKKRRII